VQDELAKLLQAPEPSIDLFHAALLVSKLDKPELDIEAYRAQFEEMARQLSARLGTKAEDAAKLDALTKYLFTENGFHGSRSDYYNKANSYINDVLDDREGLPITLSVLFLELARRIGLEKMAGVSLPGHFIVKFTPKKGADQLIDVFDGGKFLSRAQAAQLVLNYTDAPLKDEQLNAASKRDIIIRMLQNLLHAAQRAESSADGLRYLDVIVALAPDAPLERYSRALLRLRSGDLAGAKQDFKWLLDTQPAEINLERLTELYQSL
jgi:regulator of sirC expression with transglutaminase-like and TPR domain